MAGISDVAKATGLKEEQVKAVFEVVRISPEPVIIRGFGTFKTVARAARTARNPRTGEEVLVPAKTVLSFKAAKK